MNGRELLALLLMILPSVLATALVTFTLVQYTGVAPGLKAERQAIQAAARPASASRPVTQKRMRDPWQKASYDKTSSAPVLSRCDPEWGSRVAECYYW